jgi:hypothetical protein
VISTKNQARRRIAAGVFAVAAVAAPFAASALTTIDGSDAVALPPGCLAWFGNAEDGKCLGYSNGNPVVGGTPEFGFGNDNGTSGPNFSTGPLVPGRTIDQPLA